MPSVSWTFNLSVLNGQSVSLTEAITVDAIDSVAVSIPNDATSHDIQVTTLQPTDNAMFLVISSSQYDGINRRQSPAGGAFQYQVVVDTATVATYPSATTFYTLDSPQFLTSATLANLLIPISGVTPAITAPTPVTIAFTNNTSATANISILIGRKAS